MTPENLAKIDDSRSRKAENFFFFSTRIKLISRDKFHPPAEKLINLGSPEDRKRQNNNNSVKWKQSTARKKERTRRGYVHAPNLAHINYPPCRAIHPHRSRFRNAEVVWKMYNVSHVNSSRVFFVFSSDILSSSRFSSSLLCSRYFFFCCCWYLHVLPREALFNAYK